MDGSGQQVSAGERVDAPPRDGRGRATLTPEQSARLFEAIKARQAAKGWPIGARFSAATYYDIRAAGTGGGGTLLSTLAKANRWMRWADGAAEGVALRGERPVGLEEVVARLRRAVEVRCSQRGWVPAKRVEPGVWAKLCDEDTDELPSAPELVDLDDAVEWVRGSAEKLARDGVDPVPSEGGPNHVVVHLDAPAGTADLSEWFQVSGRVTASAAQMTPEERGKLTAVVQRMLDDWLERRS